MEFCPERLSEVSQSRARPWRAFGATKREWDDWRWQMKNRMAAPDDFRRWFSLCREEEEGLVLAARKGGFGAGLTPYFASLMDREDPGCPLRRQFIPRVEESLPTGADHADPLGEEDLSPTPAVVHRYPDRVLFLASNVCSSYCRYCNRKRMVGDSGRAVTDAQWEEGIAYVASNPAIRDVLVSGGDPLTLTDGRLLGLLGRLRAIPHVEILRVGTRVPVTLPQRVTPALVRGLKALHPLYVSLHVVHPKELAPEVERACLRLADAGIPVGSQSVLLAGINDDEQTLKTLMSRLLKVRVRPYYLFQCDQIEGTAHFRTPLQKGIDLMKGLIGHTSGYAVPKFAVDLTGGGGKVPLLPEYRDGSQDGKINFQNFAGERFEYLDDRC
jgi:lysine 2,3-aminomutase